MYNASVVPHSGRRWIVYYREQGSLTQRVVFVDAEYMTDEIAHQAVKADMSARGIRI
jgi:hypothetical protein